MVWKRTPGQCRTFFNATELIKCVVFPQKIPRRKYKIESKKPLTKQWESSHLQNTQQFPVLRAGRVPISVSCEPKHAETSSFCSRFKSDAAAKFSWLAATHSHQHIHWNLIGGRQMPAASAPETGRRDNSSPRTARRNKRAAVPNLRTRANKLNTKHVRAPKRSDADCDKRQSASWAARGRERCVVVC